MNSVSEDKWKKEISLKFDSILKGSRILEIGSALANHHGFFLQSSEYLGMDVASGGGVDIVSIAHEYDGLDNSFDAVCSFSELEHDMYWRKTLMKMVKLTRPGGLIFFSCPYNWEEHGTNRTSPEQSYTTKISKEWGDYYENRSPDDIKSVWNLDELFSDYYLGLNPYDDGFTVFWGIKR